MWETVTASGVGQKENSKPKHCLFHIEVGDSSGIICFNFKKEGNIMQDCPEMVDRQGPVCFNCRKEGYIARVCVIKSFIVPIIRT